MPVNVANKFNNYFFGQSTYTQFNKWRCTCEVYTIVAFLFLADLYLDTV